MKQTLFALAAFAGVATFASAAEYTVFRVCEDQHVLRTSDGADAGHVEYIVVDPGQHTVVSTIITGGVLADRTIAVPVSSFRYGAGREVTLTEITRERLVAAPVIESTQITAIQSGRFEPALVERSTTYFRGGANVNVNVNATRSSTTVERDGARMRGDRAGASGTATVTTEADRARNANEPNTPGSNRATTRTGKRDATATERSTNREPGDRNTGAGNTTKAGDDETTGKNGSSKRGTTKNDGDNKEKAATDGAGKATTRGKANNEEPGSSSTRSSGKTGADADRSSTRTSTERSSTPGGASDRPSSGARGTSGSDAGASGSTRPASSGTGTSGSGSSGAGTTGGSSKSGAGTSGSGSSGAAATGTNRE